MTHQPTVTKNYKNTQSKFDSNLGSCDVSVAPRAVRLSTSPGTQLLLLPKGNSDVPLFFHFLNYPPYVCKPSKNCNPAALCISNSDSSNNSDRNRNCISNIARATGTAYLSSILLKKKQQQMTDPASY